MRRAGLLLASIVLAVAAVACGSDSGDDGKDSSVPYGAQSCSDWSGHMSDSERWDAATELLTNARGIDGHGDDDWAPSTGAVKQFEADLGILCDRGATDDLLAPLADEVYETNRAFYNI